MVLGITGKYCSGKSVLARLFVSCGFEHIDVDLVGHEALEAKREELRAAFGDEILDGAAGRINRKALGRIVFRDRKKRKILEEIVHPWMVQKVAALLNTEDVQSSKAYVISAALLHKMKLDVLCDVVVLVETHVIIRALRAMKRDGLSLVSMMRRFSSQAHIPTRKTLNRSGKTAEVQTIKGVYSTNEYKEKLQRYLTMP